MRVNALRSLRRAPAFAMAMILSLAIGMAAVATLFTVVYGVLFAPLPYGEPDRLVSLGMRTPQQARIEQPPAVFLSYAQQAHLFDELAFYRTGNANIWTDGDVAERVSASWVSASMVPLLRVAPLLGRAFTDAEQGAGAQTVLLSESIWRNRFGAANDVLGKTMVVNSVEREIIGVMPASFSFPDLQTQLWLPARVNQDAIVRDVAYAGVARLAPGASVETVQPALVAVLPRLSSAYPTLRPWLDAMQGTPEVLPLHQARTGDMKEALYLLAAASLLVLLVAWANAANLMLMRADGRMPELAVRKALGAGFQRIAGHFFGEALVLGLIAGVLALVMAFCAIEALVASDSMQLPRFSELKIGPMTLAFLVLVTALGVLICSAVPALRIQGASRLIATQSGRGESMGRARRRLQSGMVILQIAMAFVVVVGASLLLRTTQHLSEVQPGFNADGVTVVWTQLPFARYDDAAAVAFYTQLTERVQTLPTVRAAGLSTHLPLGSGELFGLRYKHPEGDERLLATNVIDQGYFSAMRIPVVSGRGFFALPAQNTGDVLINQRAAESLFGTPSKAIGRTLTLVSADASAPTYTVVGVVGDVREHTLSDAPEAMVYRPQVVPTRPNVELSARRSLALLVRADGEPKALLTAVRQIVRELDPSVPIFGVQTMSEVVQASTTRLTLVRRLLSVAAVITLVLGMLGLYGVLAYWVALGSRETAIRVALGARPDRVAGAVVRRALALCGVGICTGVLLYAPAMPWLSTLLFGVSTGDPLTLLGATFALTICTLVASSLPALRAAHIDPITALQAQ